MGTDAILHCFMRLADGNRGPVTLLDEWRHMARRFVRGTEGWMALSTHAFSVDFLKWICTRLEP